MLSGWFWANLLLLVVLWVVFMVFVYKPIRDSLLDYKWAAISFVITFVLKSQIANPKLYNKKASDGKLITSRAYYAFCCVAWTFYGFSTGAFAALTRCVYYILYAVAALFVYDSSLLPGPLKSLDAGHASFCSLLWAHHLHHNVTLVSAAKCLQEAIPSKTTPAFRRARNKLQLAYTLLNNPAVAKHRRDHAALESSAAVDVLSDGDTPRTVKPSARIHPVGAAAPPPPLPAPPPGVESPR